MKACLALIVFASVLPGAASRAEAAWVAEAPARKLAIEVAPTDSGGALRYHVLLGGASERREVLGWSPLGIRRADEDFVGDLKVGTPRTRTVSDKYDLLRGKQRHVEARGTELTIPVTNAVGHKMEIVLRAYDDGVAFRYRFVDKGVAPVSVVLEETGFAVPTTAHGWLLPHDDPSEWTPAYEAAFMHDVPAGTAAPKAAGWALPALFGVPRAGGTDWLLITEAGVDRTYCATRLAQKADGGLYRVRLPDLGEGTNRGGVEPTAITPWETPWRAIVVGELSTIVESSLVTTLAPPSRVKDTRWIKPGRASWSWWSKNTGDAARLGSFVDLAGDMGWEYSLLDAGWTRLKEDELRALVERAKQKNVRLLVWYDSGTRTSAKNGAPKEKMYERAMRRAELARIAKLGIAGVKIDFFQSDKQVTINQYLDILEDAAEQKLVVNFHGATIPHGWERTYPHLLSLEAVRGAECYRFDPKFPAVAPQHNAILPFTRNAIGPMDYTPVTLSDQKHPHITTNAHELALAVVYESGIVHFADAVESYAALADEPKAFLKRVPAAWDRTVLVAGEPGRYAVVARRNGDRWWVGGISGEDQPRTLELPLGFLDARRGDYAATVIADGDGARKLATSSTKARNGGTIAVTMQPRGGFAIELAPVK